MHSNPPGRVLRVRGKALCLLLALSATALFYRHAQVWEVTGAAIDLALSESWSDTSDPRPPIMWKRVAHAGGTVNGLGNTNSLDALDASYAAGHRVFEVDFERTTDGRVVALHDWEHSWMWLHPKATRSGRQDLRTFLSEPMISCLRPMTWETIAEWLRHHDDALLVTDVKDDNVWVLAVMAADRDLVPRVIPQIYAFREYAPVRALGYQRILLTLYRLRWGTWSILRFLRSHPAAGIVCAPARARRGALGIRARELGVPVFAHTVNDEREVTELESVGVSGIYTDVLHP